MTTRESKMVNREDMEFDKHSLDNEWERQPLLCMKYGELWAEAQFKKDKHKERLDVLRAQLDNNIRTLAAAAQEKITEAAIATKIVLNSEYQKANNEYLEALRDTRLLEVARDAIEHRKKALEKETDLFLSGYWSEPRVDKLKRQQVGDDYSSEARRSLSRRDPRK